MHYAIKVIRPDGSDALLADHGGTMTFSDFERALRLSQRLAFAGDGGEIYEVVSLVN
jgi:hypothetical protein